MTLRDHHALCLTTLAEIYTKARNCDQETWLAAADLAAIEGVVASAAELKMGVSVERLRQGLGLHE